MIGKLMGKTEVERENREAWLERSMSKTELKKRSSKKGAAENKELEMFFLYCTCTVYDE
jgi:hypothetical protein